MASSEARIDHASSSEESFEDSTSQSLETEDLIVAIDAGNLHNRQDIFRLVDRWNAKVVKTVSPNNETDAFRVMIPQRKASAFTAETSSSGLARYVEPNIKYRTQLAPNDPYWFVQWGPQKIQADWAWNTTVGNSSVLVAVIDTGIDYNHPDLVANYIPLGCDWINNDTDPMDDNGHGTHCAGIITAVLNNSVGIAGIAQVRIMAEKGLDVGGSGDTIGLANAIIHAADQGADVISMSWGAYGKSRLLHEALQYAYGKGVLLVAAAGNDNTAQKLYPAAYEEVIAVAATDEEDDPAYFSNYGDWIELAAPGVNIYSTISETHDPRFEYPYCLLSGTSMATPHVAGLGALVLSKYPNATSSWVRLRIRDTADDLGETGFDSFYGHGRINARKALEKQVPDHDLLIMNWETPQYGEPGKTVLINATIFNFGKAESNLTTQLLVDGNVVDSVSTDFLAGGELATVTCPWTPMAEGAYNVTALVRPVRGENSTADNAKSKQIIVSNKVVALLQNYEPWAYPADEQALALYGIPCAIFDSTTFGSANLTKFLKVVIAADQDQGFYHALYDYRWWFDDYVWNGGTLEIHAADGGYNQGYAPGYLPGGLMWRHRAFENVTITDRTHPIVNSPNRIADDELGFWGLSAHGYFTNYPSDSQVIVIDPHLGRVLQLVFNYGSGRIIASGLTLEWAYRQQYSRILENTLLYTVPDYPTINHDVSIVSVSPSQTSMYAGATIDITVVTRNEGNATETFRVTAHYDNATIGTRNVVDLAPGREAVMVFGWNTSGLAPRTRYEVWAEASVILNEANTTNNIYADGEVKMRMLGDINDDDRVDIYDVVLAVQAYGSKLGDPEWNPYVDLAPRWGIIEIYDIVTLVYHYGS